MVKDEYIKQPLVQEITELVDSGLGTHRKKINQDFSSHIEEITEELWLHIESIYSRYEQMKACNNQEDLEWIYISFLRSSFIDQFPAYRIDLYDKTDRISEKECYGMWKFEYMYCDYYHTVRDVEKKLKAQTRLKIHEIEYLIIRLREEIRIDADNAIKLMILKGKEMFENKITSRQEIKIMVGDFFGKTEMIAKIVPKQM